MKTYKVLKGYYKKVKEEEITIPKNMKLLYNNGWIGPGLHDGHNHYLGCMKLSELPKDIEDYCEFCDLAFFVFDDIKFIDETPEFYTPEEFMNEFNLNNYYIEFRTKGYFKNRDLLPKHVESDEEFKKFIDDNYVKGSTYEICKITNIKGPYSVTLFSVSNGNKFNGDEYFNITEDTGVYVQYICDSEDLLIYKDDDYMFKKMLNNVLKRANYERI
jgi:hypothetical protein